MLLTREQILNADDVLFREVAVPEWGGTVRLKSLNGHDKDRFEMLSYPVVDGQPTFNEENVRARLCALTIVDEAGQLLFTADEIAALGRKSGVALDRVFKVARELAGLTNEDVQELAKN